MKEYLKISILLSLYGIFKEFRPGEPYLVPYMTQPPLNLTAEQVSQEIYPVTTYATLALLVIVFLITDFLRYKLVIIAQAVSAIATYLMLIVCRGVFQVQLIQIVYGLYLAGEVAYFTYIYAKVDKAHFQEVTSYTRSAYLFGKCLSGVTSQVIVYYDLTSYMGLMWITIGSEFIALIWAVLLPSVDKSMYFHRTSVTGENKCLDNNSNNGRPLVIAVYLLLAALEFKFVSSNLHQHRMFAPLVRYSYTFTFTLANVGTNLPVVVGTTTRPHSLWAAAGFLREDLSAAFTQPYVLKWAAWWVLASGGYFMVTSFVQLLWEAVRPQADVQLNGAVETAYTLLGALASIAVGRVQVDWRALGEPLLAACSLAAAALLFAMSSTESSAIAYGGFVLFTVIFQTMITVANSEVAKNVNRESYGLVFGITTFGVYIVLSIFFYIALQVFQLDVRAQFVVYAIYHSILGAVFLVAVVVRFIISVL